MKGFVIFVTLITPFFITNSYANNGKNTAISPQNCSKIANDIKRLACYDNLFKPAPPISTIDTKQASPKAEGNEALDKNVSESNNIANSADTSLNNAIDNVQETTKKYIDGSQVDVSDVDSFGAENIRKSDDERQSSISDIVVSIRKSKLGIRSFTLKNGQVWRETETSRLKIAVNDTVIIKKGVFSSYHLTTEESNRRARVKRIK